MPAEFLTDRRVETAKPSAGQERLELRDTKVRGLELRVGKKEGAKTWALVYTRQSDGRVRRATIGPFPEIGLAEARRRALGLKVNVESGADPATGIQESNAAPTFRSLSDEWIKIHGPNKSVKSLADNVSMLRRHILPVIGAKKAEDVTKRDVLRLLDLVALKPDARHGKKTRTSRKSMDVPVLEKARQLSHRPARVYELIRAIYRWAISRDILPADPTAGMKPPLKKERPRERALTAEEIKQFWTRLGDTPLSEGVQLAMKLALVTAQRIGEVSNIAKSELVLDGPTPIWSLPAERSKNREGHRIPLSPLAVRLIKEAQRLAGDSKFLFPSPKEAAPIGAGAATKGMQRARPTFDLADFRVHDLRRTAATGMAELGISPHTISLVLNHISARTGNITSAVYVKYSYDKEKREALDAWGRRLEEILAVGGVVTAGSEGPSNPAGLKV
jgi:integrase